jgi:hypothetical protein
MTAVAAAAVLAGRFFFMVMIPYTIPAGASAGLIPL